jgi:hypothetical protein
MVVMTREERRLRSRPRRTPSSRLPCNTSAAAAHGAAIQVAGDEEKRCRSATCDSAPHRPATVAGRLGSSRDVLSEARLRARVAYLMVKHWPAVPQVAEACRSKKPYVGGLTAYNARRRRRQVSGRRRRSAPQTTTSLRLHSARPLVDVDWSASAGSLGVVCHRRRGGSGREGSTAIGHTLPDATRRSTLSLWRGPAGLMTSTQRSARVGERCRKREAPR